MISLDEWNVWYRGESVVPGVEPWQCGSPILEEIYDMADVLVTGGALLSMIDHADRLKMACIAQTVNVIAPIMTQKGGKAWKQTIYYPLLETSKHARGVALRVINDSPEYEVEGFYTGKVKYLRSSAVLREDAGELTIFAINRANEEMEFSAGIAGFDNPQIIEAKEIHNPDLDAVNTPDKENVVTKLMADTQYKIGDNLLEAKLKPYSWNMFRVKVQSL
jgi:alpha-N-arabinofuranosidase